MKILLDACVPRPLRKFLPDHTVITAQESGWGQLKNGELLKVADASFDVFITTDQNLRYQQNLTSQRLAILVLPTTSWPKIQSHAAEVAATVNELRPGEFRELTFSA